MLSRTARLLSCSVGAVGCVQWRLLSGGGGAAAASAAAADAASLGSVPLAFPTVCIWGSNTDVGKTLFSAGLAAAGRRAGVSRALETVVSRRRGVACRGGAYYSSRANSPV